MTVTRNSRWTTRALACVAVMSACNATGSADANQLRITIDSLNGTPRVHSEGDPPVWSVERTVRIGAPDGAGPDVFGRVQSLALDDELNIYVADAQASQVQVFDSSGTFVRSLGREGSGPGEFRDARALGWLGDLLAVQDPRNARIGYLDPQGAWAGSWRWQPLSGPQVHLLNGSADNLYTPVTHGTGANIRIGWIAVGDSTEPDTLVPPLPPEVPRGPVCPHPGTGGLEFFGAPHQPSQRVAGGPGNTLYVGWSGRYAFAQTSLVGDTVRLIEREFTPAPVTDEEWSAATQDFRDFRAEQPNAVCDPPEQTRPASKPAFRWLGGDVDGRLWVETHRADGLVFEVFDQTGALVGQLQLPERDERVPLVARGNRIAIVTQDELDVQYVEVFRFTPGPSS